MKNGENNNGKVADKTYLISLIINIDWIFELWDRFLFHNNYINWQNER